MSAADTTLKATWTPKEFSITFNANGGTVDVQSKIVTYDSTYSDLPIPTREDYKFVGWFTSSSGGTQIISSTEVKLSGNQTLYARWSLSEMMARVDNQKIWSHKENIKRVVFEDTLSPKETDISYDISSVSDGSVMAYLVPDEVDSSKYVLYIQANGKVMANSNSGNLFYNFTSLESIDNLQNLNTKNITDMWGMFENCSSLTALDVSHFDTSKVDDMYGMFENCSSLTALDVSNFDTSNVVNMSSMFDGCSSLTALDVSNFDTSKVVNMWSMFCGCSGLTVLDVSNFDTSKVKLMFNMFSRCSSLTSLNVSNFNTSNVTTMGGIQFDLQGIFYNCSGLTSLNLSNWNISSVNESSNAFKGISSTVKITVNSDAVKEWAINASNTPKLTTDNFITA